MSLKEHLFDFSKTRAGELLVGLVFGKLTRFLPVKRVKETDKVIAFWHPRPFWEKHIVIVPKKAIKSLTDLDEKDREYISEIFLVAKEIIKELGWDKDSYTILVNGGKRQEVGQLHFHLESGKEIRK